MQHVVVKIIFYMTNKYSDIFTLKSEEHIKNQWLFCIFDVEEYISLPPNLTKNETINLP